MHIKELDHKNICLLGYGQEGKATYVALKQYCPHAKITVADARTVEVDAKTPLITGANYLERLDDFDVIIKSPGITWQPPAHFKPKLTSATNLFFNSMPTGVRTIGVTGTKGKSTTAHLIAEALKTSFDDVILAGNIGRPMLEFLPQLTRESLVVLELSSYQLELLNVSPHIAVVTSFFPDHLDYHGSLASYLEAKKNIARFQTADDIVFYNTAQSACTDIASTSIGQKIGYSSADFPPDQQVQLQGAANLSNLAAAYLVATHLGASPQQVVQALAHTIGLPHRQQIVSRRNGFVWVDDSAANTPEAAIAAIDSFGENLETLIVGGLDRGYDLKPLAQVITASGIKNLVLFPETGPKIRQLLDKAASPHRPRYLETSDMAAAVAFAARHTTAGKTILLSNGAPSYNLFANFTARADAFLTAIDSLNT